MKGFPDLPPIWLLGFMALAWLLARFVPLATSSAPALGGAGLVLILLGIGLIAWSAIWFWRKKTTIEPHHAPGTLIVEGPYRIGRNPIYLGMVLILTGHVLSQGALSAAVLPPLLLLVLTQRFARPEEAGLIAAFGDEGRAFIARTRRWI